MGLRHTEKVCGFAGFLRSRKRRKQAYSTFGKGELQMKKIKLVMYHYVRDLKNSAYPAIKGLDIGIFEKQMEHMKQHYTFLRMEDLIDSVKSGDDSLLPENGVLLTFDDGYADHYREVYPVLKRYGVQGSFFPNAMAVKEHRLLTVNRIHFILAAVEGDPHHSFEELKKDCFSMMDEYRSAGADIGENDMYYGELAKANRWDPAEVIFVKRLLQNALPEQIRTQMAERLFEKYVGVSEETFAKDLYMTGEEIREMKEGGMFFGLHGYDHYWLGKLPEEEMKQDIEKALNFFEGIIDKDGWVMNYPYGNYSAAVLDYIRSKGCVLGLSTEPETAVFGVSEMLALPRYDANDVYPKGEKV